jgi:hypothetical protein
MQLFILVGINVQQNGARDQERKRPSEASKHECAGRGSSRAQTFHLQLRITNTRRSCSPRISAAHTMHTTKPRIHYHPPIPPTIRALAEDRLRALPTLTCLPPALGSSSSILPVHILRRASIARPRRTARRRSANISPGQRPLKKWESKETHTPGRMPVRKDIERQCSHRTRRPPIEEKRRRCVVQKRKFVHSSAPNAKIDPSTDDRWGQRGREAREWGRRALALTTLQTRNSPAAARNEHRKRPEGRNRAQ